MNIQNATSNSILSLSDTDIETFCDFFYRKTGILFNESKRYFIEKRILKRIEETGCNDFRTYLSKVRFGSGKAELQELINAMTVNETYFFREDHQFDALIHEALEEIIKMRRNSAPISIWSIPCSTGEEPYSIAIKLLEEWPQIENYDVNIQASDIDTTVLAAAEKAVYSDRSISRLPKNYLTRHFKNLSNGQYALNREIVDCVDRSEINVSEAVAMHRRAKVDVIFCRNMLIYFDDDMRRKVIDHFYDLLNDGGFLFLGHSESISRTSSLFRVRRFKDCTAYQKSG